MAEATEALARKDLNLARSLLGERLEAHPTDIAAMRLLAELERLQGRHEASEALLTRCLAIAPDAPGLRQSLTLALLKQFKTAAALVHIDRMLEAEPASQPLQTLKAAALVHLGENDQAASLYERLLAVRPDVANLWLSYGDTLKISGRQPECIAAYNRAIQLSPGLGKAYWSLANLKTARFAEHQIAAMQAALNRREASREDRLHLHYALGHALEDRGEFAASFQHYDEGAKLWRAQAPYNADHTTALLERSRAVFTAELFRGAPRRGASGG